MKKFLLSLLLCLLTVPAFAGRGDGTYISKCVDLSTATSGDNTTIAAVTGKRILVMKMWIVSAAAVNLTFKDGTTAYTSAAMPMTAAGSSIFFPFDTEPYFVTTAGNAFTINLSGAVQITGQVCYITQ